MTLHPGQVRLLEEDCRQALADRVEDLASLRDSRVLIVGGTGFVGKWLTELLTHLNDHHHFGVRILLLSPTARDFPARHPRLGKRADVHILEMDVRQVVELPLDIQWIVHAGASPDNREHASNPIRTMNTIVQGTQALLEASQRLPDLQQLLYVSSGLIYGECPPGCSSIPEDMMGTLDCSFPGVAYAEAKRAAETLCAAYRSQQGLPIVVTRPFAFVGPYQLLDRPWAINNFVRDALMGGPIRIQGDGQTQRSYMYGSDLAYWLMRVLTAARSGTTYNIGSPEGIRLKDLATEIASLMPTPPRIELSLFKGGKPERACWIPDVSQAERELRLTPRVDLDTALRRTLRWHQTALADQERPSARLRTGT